MGLVAACCWRQRPVWPATQFSTSNAPCIWDRSGGCWSMASVSKLSAYGSVRVPGAGLAAAPLPWPVVVVREYTMPGWAVKEKLPLVGVMSAEWTNQVLGLAELTLVDQTWTVPVDRPPVTL